MDERLQEIQDKIDQGESISEEDTAYLHEDHEETPQDDRVEAQDAS